MWRTQESTEWGCNYSVTVLAGVFVGGGLTVLTWREHTRNTPKRGSQTTQSRTVEGLAFGPGVLDPKPPASKQASESMQVGTWSSTVLTNPRKARTCWGALRAVGRDEPLAPEGRRRRASKCKHVTTTLVPHVLVCVCVCVCVCMSSEASSLKELVARLLTACSQNLTQNNMCNMSNHKSACAMYPKFAHAKN